MLKILENAVTRHILRANHQTACHGIIDRDQPSVLTIRSGDIVELDTLAMWRDRADADLTLERVSQLRAETSPAGPHAMTGPIAVDGAQPGDVLKVEIGRIEIGSHGFNLVPEGGGRGVLKERFAKGNLVHFQLDNAAMTTRFGDLATIRLRPFFGIMGVAPAEAGAFPSTIPGPFGGNIDCPDLVEGTTLFLPVWQPGAGFYVGDAHAAQGCGEVSQTGLETTVKRADLTISILRDQPLERPYGETPTHLISMGFDEKLKHAAQQAVSDMIALLVRRYGASESDAYVLCSLQGDLVVTQMVNGTAGIHMRMPKEIFTGEPSAGVIQ